MEEIRKARQTLIDAFKKDPDFRYGYLANIARRIYDDQRRGYELKKGDFVNKANNLSTIQGCNNMADDIMRLIFE